MIPAAHGEDGVVVHRERRTGSSAIERVESRWEGVNWKRKPFRCLPAAKPPVYKSRFSPIVIIIIITISFCATLLLFAGRKHGLMVNPIPMVDQIPMCGPHTHGGPHTHLWWTQYPCVDPIPMVRSPLCMEPLPSTPVYIEVNSSCLIIEVRALRIRWEVALQLPFHEPVAVAMDQERAAIIGPLQDDEAFVGVRGAAPHEPDGNPERWECYI